MLDSSSSPSANCIAANFLLTECHVAKIATFCGPFAAKLCTAVPENYVARMLSRRFFSRPLDCRNLVRIFMYLKSQGFFAVSKPYFSNCCRDTDKTSAPIHSINGGHARLRIDRYLIQRPNSMMLLKSYPVPTCRRFVVSLSHSSNTYSIDAVEVFLSSGAFCNTKTGCLEPTRTAMYCLPLTE
jgi:hypothetical protein